MSFFPAPIVKNILVRFSISEAQAEEIAEYLSTQDQAIIKIIESKAAKMKPNPLTEFEHREAAVDLYKETLHQVFVDALSNEGVKLSGQEIKEILAEIQLKKGKLFSHCIKLSQKS